MEQDATHFMQQNGEFTHSGLPECLAPVHGEPSFTAHVCTRQYLWTVCVQGITNVQSVMHVVYGDRAIMHIPESAQDQHLHTKKSTQYHEEQAETTAIAHYMPTKNLILGHHVHAVIGCTRIPKMCT